MSPTDRSRPRMSATLGRRRSASITSTRWPADATTSARFTSVVVLPSAGSELVTTMTLRGLSTSTNCRFVRSCRNASDRGDCGSSSTISGRFGTFASNATVPRLGAPDAARSCSGDFTDVSSAFRASAAPMPTARPASRPSASSTGSPAEDGAVGTAARCTTRTATGWMPPRPDGRSSSSTRAVKTSPAVSAVCAARAGSTVDDRHVDEHRVETRSWP